MNEPKSISIENLNRFCGTATATKLRKTFGKSTADLSLEELLSFYEVAGSTPSNSDVVLLILGLYYSTNKSPKKTKDVVPFEHKLAAFYNKSTDTTKKNIHNLLTRDFDQTGIFARKFSQLCRQMLSMGYSLSNINYSKLLTDLQYWNSSNRYTQLNWAKALFNTETNNLTTTESEDI